MPISVISSDNIEVSNILYTNSTDPQSTRIEAFLNDHHFSNMATTHISDILLMKHCATSDQYDWLAQIPECTKSYSGADLDLYSCK